MTGRSAGAVRVPAQVWTEPDMSAALAARDVAQVFRLLQRRTRASQSQLGVAVGLSQAQVSEIMGGARRVTSIDVLDRIAAGLDMPAGARHLLFLGEREPRTATAGPAPAPAAVAPPDGTPPYVPDGPGGSFADLAAAFSSRSEFASQLPPHTLFDRATEIRAAGVSLNLICQQYAENRLRQLLRDGARLRCLFLDPAGESVKAREREEEQRPGALATMIDMNIGQLSRTRDRLPADARDRLQLAVYDETVRFNLTFVDDKLCVAQPYLPRCRGVDCPTMVIERRWSARGLYPVFAQVFGALWEGGRLI